MFDGLCGMARAEKLPYFIKSWIYSDDYRNIGNAKYAICALSSENFECKFLKYTTPYFEDLKPCLLKFHELFNPSRVALTHKDFVAILKDAKDSLPTSEPQPKGPSPSKTKKQRHPVGTNHWHDVNIPDLVNFEDSKKVLCSL